MEVVAATNVAVADRLAVRPLVLLEEGAIETVLEDRANGGDGSGLDRNAAPTRGVDARPAIGARQGENPQAGSKALFGMRAGDHDRFAQGGGRWADLLRVGHDAGRRPGCVAPVRAGHVLGDGGVAAPVRRPRMAGDALSFVEDLDGLVGDADVDEFLDQPERRGVPVAVDLDMVVGRNPAALPNGEGVGFIGQRLQRRLVDRGEQFGPARVVALHDAGVDGADEFLDRDIEIGDAEETAIAQPGQNPPFDDQH